MTALHALMYLSLCFSVAVCRFLNTGDDWYVLVGVARDMILNPRSVSGGFIYTYRLTGGGEKLEFVHKVRLSFSALLSWKFPRVLRPQLSIPCSPLCWRHTFKTRQLCNNTMAGCFCPSFWGDSQETGAGWRRAKWISFQLFVTWCRRRGSLFPSGLGHSTLTQRDFPTT